MKLNTCCKKMAKQCTNELVTEYPSRNKCDTQRPNNEASCDEARRLTNVLVLSKENRKFSRIVYTVSYNANAYLLRECSTETCRFSML
jgi:23S rRNA maturation-related 3'-5' exoribonuclease YhaM